MVPVARGTEYGSALLAGGVSAVARYRNATHGGIKDVSVYNDIMMTPLTPAGKKREMQNHAAWRNKNIALGRSRLRAFAVVLDMGLDQVDTSKKKTQYAFWDKFRCAIRRASTQSVFQRWKKVDPSLSSFDITLMEWMSMEVDQLNGQALYCHTDGNPVHQIETMISHGRVAANDSTPTHRLVQNMVPADLALPIQGVTLRMAQRDVAHLQLANVPHVPDHSRNLANGTLAKDTKGK